MGKPKTPRRYTTETLQKARHEVHHGMTHHKASAQFGIPRSTLSAYVKKSVATSDPKDRRPNQHLTHRQEERLCQWILRQESLGYAPTYSHVRAVVQSMLKAEGGSTAPLSKHWVSRFVKRHAQLKSKIGKVQESIRFDGFTPKAIHWYFDILENNYSWIKRENMANMDEGGILMGMGTLSACL